MSHCASGASPTGVPKTRGMSSEYAHAPRPRFTSSLKDVYARPSAHESEIQNSRLRKPARGPTEAGHCQGTPEENQNVAHGAMKPEPDDVVHGFRRILIEKEFGATPSSHSGENLSPRVKPVAGGLIEILADPGARSLCRSPPF
jgi:hypothetical protein